MARRSLEQHDHSKSGSGGDDLNPKSIGKETPAESISTEDLTTDEIEVIFLFESGMDNSAGNNDWGQSTSKTVSETFSTTFGASPRVAVNTAQASNVDLSEFRVGANASTTGVDVEIHQMAAEDRSTVTNAYRMHVVAFGRGL